MTRYMIGGVILLSMALITSLMAVQMYRAEAANERRHATIAQNLAEGTAFAAKEREQALLARIDAIEESLTGMQAGLRQNSVILNDQLKRLYEVQPEEGQTDENLECLDARVPGVVSELLRSALRQAGDGPAATDEDSPGDDGPVPGPGVGGDDLP